MLQSHAHNIILLYHFIITVHLFKLHLCVFWREKNREKKSFTRAFYSILTLSSSLPAIYAHVYICKINEFFATYFVKFVIHQSSGGKKTKLVTLKRGKINLKITNLISVRAANACTSFCRAIAHRHQCLFHILPTAPDNSSKEQTA